MLHRVLIFALLAAMSATAARAQVLADNGFTYQGRLTDAGAAPTGPYDIQFTLWDASSGGAANPTIISLDNVPVSAGLFTARLDFGTAFASYKRWLQISVRPGVSVGAYTTLQPRQEITAAPISTFSLAPWVNIPGAGIQYNTGYSVSVGASPSPADRLLVSANASNVNGIHGTSDSPILNAAGVQGDGTGSNNPIGVYGTSFVQDGAGIVGKANTTGGYFEVYSGTGSPVGVYARANVSGGVGVSASGQYLGVSASCPANIALYGDGNIGVQGSGATIGVDGGSFRGTGVHASASGTAIGGFGTAIVAEATGGRGIRASSTGDDGVYATSTGAGKAGVSASSNNAGGYGGYFNNTAGGIGLVATGNGGGIGGAAFTATNGNTSGIAVVSSTSSSDANMVISQSGTGDALRVFTSASSGSPLFQVTSIGDVVVDANFQYTFDSAASAPGPQHPKLRFGTGSGEWICSERVNANSQFRNGLNFYTAFNPRMSISNNGTCFNLSGSWSSFSDRRLKKNISTLDGSLDRLLSLRGVSYEYSDPEAIHATPGVRFGFVAQEAEDVFPSWVATESNGYKSVTIQGFEALTVEAIRDLRSEKDTQVAEIKSENADLRARVARLESLVQSLVGTSKK